MIRIGHYCLQDLHFADAGSTGSKQTLNGLFLCQALRANRNPGIPNTRALFSVSRLRDGQKFIRTKFYQF